jgi:zinc transport system substrate-binding protein
MLNTSEGLKENYIELNEGTTHSHGPEGDHVHKGYAFTTWLNMKFAIRQAESIKTRLNQLLPDQQDAFEKNFIDLKTDLGILDDQLTTIAGDLRNTSLFGSHPVYQYLANGYGLTILSEHWEPDQKVSEKQWSLFIDNLKRHPGTIMLWEGPPLPEVEKRLLSSGIKAVVFNPCGNTPESGDFLSVMNKNLTNLKDNL